MRLKNWADKFLMAPPEDPVVPGLFDVTPPAPTDPPAPTTPPNPAPPVPFTGPDWQKDWPAELRDAPSMKNFKSPQDVAQAWINAQKLIGADKIPVPGKNASKEEIIGAFRKLGSPEKLEDFKYDLAVADSVDKEFLSAINKVAHENGLLPSQAKAIMDTFAKLNNDAVQLQQTNAKNQRNAQLKALSEEWGDSYANQMAKARAALTEFATPEEITQMKALGLGENPVFLKLMAKFGGTLSEDVIRGAGGQGGGGPLTPQEARNERQAIMADMNSPYYKADHPEHAAFKAKVEKLFQYEVGQQPAQASFGNFAKK